MGEFIKWSDDFSVGLNEIDSQHKKLLDIINRLYKAFVDRDEDTVLEEILNDMAEYTDYHFITEEKYFMRFNYPNMDEHIKNHKIYIEKINGFKKDFESNKKITYSVMNFLRNWIVEHIQGTDPDYVPLLKQNGVQ
jgi:hemerythrin